MLQVHRNDLTTHPRLVNIKTQCEAAYSAIWKEGGPFVRNEGGVNILVDALADMTQESLVMVRHEYPPIFQHIQAMPALCKSTAGLVLTGHPGVGACLSCLPGAPVVDKKPAGKTMFLYYALGAALASHTPIVFGSSLHWITCCQVAARTPSRLRRLPRPPRPVVRPGGRAAHDVLSRDASQLVRGK